MKGVSPILASVLVVLVAISLSGAFLVFTQQTEAELSGAGEESTERFVSGQDTRLAVEGVSGSTVFLRNAGSTNITGDDFSVFLNDVLVGHSLSDEVQPGEVAPVSVEDAFWAGHGEMSLRVTAGSASDSVRVAVDKPAGNVLDLRFDESPEEAPLVNPGFEADEDGDGIPDSWSPNTGIVSRDTSVAHSGAASIRCEDDPGFGGTSPECAFSKRFPVDEGEEYAFTYWARTDGAPTISSAHLLVYWYRSDGSTIGVDGLANTDSDSWTYLSTVRTAPADAAEAKVVTKITVDSNGDPGVGWHDDIRVVRSSSVTPVDDSGNGNDGTLENGAVFGEGRHGNGVALDGVDDYVDAGGDASLNVTDEITISAWFNMDTIHQGTGWPVIVSKEASHSNGTDSLRYGYRVHYRNSSKNLGVEFFSGQLASAASLSTAKDDFSVGEWYHVVVGYSTVEGNLSVYVDGRLEGTRTDTDPWKNTHENLTVGRRSPGGSYFAGSVDGVQIYEEFYTPEELYEVSRA